MSLSTCYNILGFGRWEELCHEYMASVLPTVDDPRMLGDYYDLSSPTWRIIFLKDDCFLQPSCEVTCLSSDSDNNKNTITTATTIMTTTMDDDYDHHHQHHHDPTTSPSNPIEPLFEGIDLYQQQQQQPQPRCIKSNESEVVPPSPSLSRSSSSSSDIEQDNIQPKKVTIKRKRKISTKQQQQQQQLVHHRQQKRYRPKKQKNHHIRYPLEEDRRSLDSTMTFFEQLSYAGIDWCRYCGTTEGVNWRPGPWGKRTLCNKHGCDYKGYGLASRLPRLDLSEYRHELIQERHRPIIQEFCSTCQERGINKQDDFESDDDDDDDDQGLVTCDGGCSRAFHRQCFHINKSRHDLWFCGSTCYENRQKKRVVVDLPRKQPLMRPLK